MQNHSGICLLGEQRKEKKPAFYFCKFHKHEYGLQPHLIRLQAFICNRMQPTGTIYDKGNHAVTCHDQGDGIARHDEIWYRVVAAFSSKNLSPLVEKKNLIRGPMKAQKSSFSEKPFSCKKIIRCCNDHFCVFSKKAKVGCFDTSSIVFQNN